MRFETTDAALAQQAERVMLKKWPQVVYAVKTLPRQHLSWTESND
jgi:hypothetical protein